MENKLSKLRKLLSFLRKSIYPVCAIVCTFEVFQLQRNISKYMEDECSYRTINDYRLIQISNELACLNLTLDKCFLSFRGIEFLIRMSIVFKHHLTSAADVLRDRFDHPVLNCPDLSYCDNIITGLLKNSSLDYLLRWGRRDELLKLREIQNVDKAKVEKLKIPPEEKLRNLLNGES